MSCVKVTANLSASLPLGASLEPPAIGVAADLEVDACCQISLPFALQVQLPGIAVSADILAPLNAFLAEVDAIVDLLELACPFD